MNRIIAFRAKDGTLTYAASLYHIEYQSSRSGTFFALGVQEKIIEVLELARL